MSAVVEIEELDAMIARTAQHYDAMPYQSRAFPQSQPARLAAIAKLFTLDVVPLEKARVLELGCASGGNLIPHATRYPKATFVGVDVSKSQVDDGQAKIAKLGLKNIEIHCKSITEIGKELGQFDYIICHGVYSWVPKQVQDAILKVSHDRLSENGVACVSYNVLPGWRTLQPLRDAFLLAIPENADSRVRVAQARNLLNFLKETTIDKGPYGDMLRSYADRMAGYTDDYIAHEFLEETNAPSTLREFASSAVLNGLGYLGECELSSMVLDNFGPKVADQIRARAGNDMMETEQYLDLISGRTFRQSLLVHSERLSKVDRNLSPQRIEDFHYLAPAGIKVEKDAGTTVFTDLAGRTLTTRSEKVCEGLERLLAALPGSANLADCTKGMKPEEATEVGDAIYRMMIIGMIQISTESVPKAEPGEKPIALPLARLDAELGSSCTTNLRHETVTIDVTSQILLPAMTGKKDRKALIDLLVSEGVAGKLNFTRKGEQVSEEAEMRSVAEELLPQLLANIAAAGLLQN